MFMTHFNFYKKKKKNFLSVSLFLSNYSRVNLTAKIIQ
jgi:hypothetical protein